METKITGKKFNLVHTPDFTKSQLYFRQVLNVIREVMTDVEGEFNLLILRKQEVDGFSFMLGQNRLCRLYVTDNYYLNPTLCMGEESEDEICCGFDCYPLTQSVDQKLEQVRKIIVEYINSNQFRMVMFMQTLPL